MKNFFSLLVFIGLTQTVGLLSAIASMASLSTWYDTLNRSTLTPPDWVFGPVWTVLYLLMALSVWHVWKEATKKTKVSFSLVLYGLQLMLNGLWSVIFFGFQMPGLALLELSLLWFVLIIMIGNFYQTSKLAAWLLVPYILWVSFAGYLNLMIWLLN